MKVLSVFLLLLAVAMFSGCSGTSAELSGVSPGAIAGPADECCGMDECEEGDCTMTCADLPDGTCLVTCSVDGEVVCTMVCDPAGCDVPCDADGAAPVHQIQSPLSPDDCCDLACDVGCGTACGS